MSPYSAQYLDYKIKEALIRNILKVLTFLMAGSALKRLMAEYKRKEKNVTLQ